MTELEEKLFNDLEIAGNAVRKGVANKVPVNIGKELERVYGNCYQRLVTLNLAPQLKKKYRNTSTGSGKKSKNHIAEISHTIEACYPCKPHKYQDSVYGDHRRVKNACKAGQQQKNKITGWRCTVCGQAKLI